MYDESSRVSDIFDHWARVGRADGMARRHGPVAKRALEKLHLPNDGWFLDIGCGNGYAVRWAAERVPQGRVFGVDISPEMIAVCHRSTSNLDNVTFLQGKFPDIDLPEGRFDAVFSMEVFYYLPDLDGALRHVCTLLRPGAWFLCVVDYYEENSESHSWPDDLGVGMDLRSQTQWAAAFTAAGFQSVEQALITIGDDGAAGSLLTMGQRPGRR